MKRNQKINCDFCEHTSKGPSGHSAHMRMKHPKYFVPVAEANGAPEKRKTRKKYTRRLTIVQEPAAHLNPIPAHAETPRTVTMLGREFKALEFCPYCPESLPSPAAGAPHFKRCPYCATALPQPADTTAEAKGHDRRNLALA